MKATTQLDIAKAAGVSQRAVASVVGKGSTNPINGSRVSEETRKLILDVAARLNYQPHRQAQLMRGVKSGVIGMIKRVGMAQYHMEKAFYAVRAIDAAGYSAMASEHLEDHALERNVDMLLNAKVEGVLLVGFNHEAAYEALHKFRDLNIPTVALPGGGLSIFPSVVTDHSRGVREMVLHLAGQGMRRLVYGCPKIDGLPDPRRTETHRRRLEGFWQGVAEAGIKKHCSVIEVEFEIFERRNRDRPFDIGGSFDYFFSGNLLAQEVLKLKSLPEALVCCNDNWALGALGVLQRAGIRVPEQMALTGFDGEMINVYSRPTLTTIQQQGREIAETGVGMLLRMIAGEVIPVGEHLVCIPGKLVVRESSMANNVRTV